MLLLSEPPRTIGPDVADTARIIVPYVPGMLHRETVQRVVVSGREFHFIAINPADPYAYGRVFARWWNTGPDLIILEQDMVPAYGWCGDFQGCDKPFCTHYYDCNTAVKAYGLGCARFSAALQSRVPSLGQQAAGGGAGRAPSTPWQALNERILDLCAHFGAPAHIHTQDVGHLHDYGQERADAGTLDT